uniref:Carboxylic ester hydrolase n=1 Tax=Cuerna arida TaxID=1464854 RepID=A0A1B6G9E2_9HEMI
MNLFPIVFVLFSSTCLCVISSGDGTVKTVYGYVQGKLMRSRGGRNFSAYLGIPYAEPPIGKLRFQPPTSLPNWEGVRDARKEGSHCPHKGLPEESEDCLYLNVFTHSVNTSSPVMVYIHGGGFHMGSSALKHLGPEYLLDRDIVLVTIQYRLGVFGFLSTEDEVVPGNMGLKDQVKALQWVQENIEKFGGDPHRVTLFGNSAGGSSVHLHMQSPLSQNLFARAISQSGTALSSFSMTSRGKVRKDTENIAKRLHCPINSSTEIIRCLQNKDSFEILTVYRTLLMSKYSLNKLLRPIVEVETEHAFLTSSPLTATTNKPWLLGVNANEGLFKVEMSDINQTIVYIKTDFRHFWPSLTYTSDLYSNLDDITDPVYRFYFENVTTTNDYAKSIEELVTDTWFAWPTEHALQKHNGSFYYYLYDHETDVTYTEIYNCSKAAGVSHTDELLVLFTQKGVFPDLNEQDTNISELMVNFWVNFATEGNPTPSPVDSDPQRKNSTDFIWESSNNSAPAYIHIQTNELKMEKKLFPDRMNFWKHLSLRYL